jgi:hypothetical protein
MVVHYQDRAFALIHSVFATFTRRHEFEHRNLREVARASLPEKLYK